MDPTESITVNFLNCFIKCVIILHYNIEMSRRGKTLKIFLATFNKMYLFLLKGIKEPQMSI